MNNKVIRICVATGAEPAGEQRSALLIARKGKSIFKKAILALAVAFGAFAQNNEWRDPKVNAVNRMPMKASYFSYESRAAAEKGVMGQSDRFLTLNGQWKFHWVRNAGQRPVNFFAESYDDASWKYMSVPGIWELNGYAHPVYVNTGWAWRNQFVSDPPNIPVENNYVGSYRRTINIPDSWTGRQIIAHFGSVTSNIYLWANGKYVGYSEDSKLAAEFDITPYVKRGENLIAFQVFRWCDGTYLEDQDFLRLSGVGRDCYLYSRDQRSISNLQVIGNLKDNYTNGVLDVRLDFSARSKGTSADLELYDVAGKLVASKNIPSTGATNAKTSVEVGAVKKWSAEEPNLYQLFVTLKDNRNTAIEVIPLKVGFRSVEIRNAQLLLNGQPILIKGVNRHEIDTHGGYHVSEEGMLRDIKALKAFNFNAVRTSHYPCQDRWYELCDEYGLYVVAEANVESHGMGYGERTLAKNPLYEAAHLERNTRNVLRNFNYPSVIIWSLGNEAGDGPNFSQCYKWIKDADPSRPVQYEQSIRTGENTDIQCPMYYSYENCERYLNNNPPRPLIQCEYAHAMGNSLGGFKEYWELIRKYPNYQGGFIWDFADQAVWIPAPDGTMIFAYGGDFDRYEAHDGNFMNNGVFAPDRKPHPHAFEAAYWQQNIWTRDDGVANGKIRVFNENFFVDLSKYALKWSVQTSGRTVKSGFVETLPATGPQKEAALALPYTLAQLPLSGELFLNVEYVLKDQDATLPAGFAVARQQLTIREASLPALDIKNVMTDSFTSAGEVSIRTNDSNYLIVSSQNFSIEFNRRTGFICRYAVGGEDYLVLDTELRPNFWRPPTDNDYGANLQRRYAIWKDIQYIRPPQRGAENRRGLVQAEMVNDIAVVTVNYNLEDLKATLTMTYKINNVGEVLVNESLKTDPSAEISEMFRFGMRMKMPGQFNFINYYGRGPIESYADRKESQFIGLFSQNVDEQYYNYLRTQETGTKSDIRWWRQVNKGGDGLMITSEEPFYASALFYPQETLDNGLEKYNSHIEFKTKDTDVTVTIDKLHAGLACVNSWGAIPLPQYRIPYKDYSFTFKLSPVKGKLQ